jgi:hypothetical protein
MPLREQIEKLRAIRREADALFAELETLAEAKRRAPAAVLLTLSRLAAELDTVAREAARARRRQIIRELTDRIDKYDTLLALELSPSTRAAVGAERATLVARRGYHRGRLGSDFDGIVGREEAGELGALIAETNAAVAAKKLAVAYIAAAIRIGTAAAKIIARIAT